MLINKNIVECILLIVALLSYFQVIIRAEKISHTLICSVLALTSQLRIVPLSLPFFGTTAISNRRIICLKSIFKLWKVPEYNIFHGNGHTQTFRNSSKELENVIINGHFKNNRELSLESRIIALKCGRPFYNEMHNQRARYVFVQ